MTTSIYVWGNHHCSNDSGFRDIFHEIISLHSQYYDIQFRSEKILNQLAINKLISNLRPWPSVLIIMFGDTNLFQNNHETLLSITSHFRNIYDHFKSYPNYKLITCGTIPPRHPTPYQLVRIKSLDCHLASLQETHGGKYVSMIDVFGPCDYESSNTLYFRGNIKLAKILAQTLLTLQ
jgi:hypothetical protein